MPFTKHGHDIFEVVSTFQKEIRRGNEELAGYWAFELCPQYETMLWNRIMVIVNEDIGLANPTLLIYASIQRGLYDAARDAGKGEAKLILANVVLAMARSVKTRLADEFQCVMCARNEGGPKLEIPDYGLDKHTRRGKQMGRGMDHFLADGARLENEIPLNAGGDDKFSGYREEAESNWRGNYAFQTWVARGKKAKEKQMNLFDGSEGENAENAEDQEEL